MHAEMLYNMRFTSASNEGTTIPPLESSIPSFEDMTTTAASIGATTTSCMSVTTTTTSIIATTTITVTTTTTVTATITPRVTINQSGNYTGVIIAMYT